MLSVIFVEFHSAHMSDTIYIYIYRINIVTEGHFSGNIIGRGHYMPAMVLILIKKGEGQMRFVRGKRSTTGPVPTARRKQLDVVCAIRS